MSAGRLDLVLGGARSGKCDYALRLAVRAGTEVTVIAPAEAGDPELERRIDIHRHSRPKSRKLLGTPTGVAKALGANSTDTLVFEDAALLVPNLLQLLTRGLSPDAQSAPDRLEREIDQPVEGELDALIAKIDKGQIKRMIVVSNKVGIGVVPATVLGRVFRDALDRGNRRLAARADGVVLCVAGLPTILKGDDPMLVDA